MKALSILLIPVSLLLLSACVPETPAPIPSTTWYVDADGDGYGDKDDAGTVSTVQPTGYVDNNTDCNDDVVTGGSINPATTEDNTNPSDLNCNGRIGDAPFIIGHYGPAGGIVFQTDGTNGLEASSADQATKAEWGCFGTAVAGANSLTNGAQNTTNILAASCSPDTVGNPLAADVVNAYSLNGYDDWYLPARDELNALYLEKDTVGGFGTDFYWSSYQGSAHLAWSQSFGAGGLDDKSKRDRRSVRAIRAF